MNGPSEELCDQLDASREPMLAAVYVLVGIVKLLQQSEPGQRLDKLEWHTVVELAQGGLEQWTITVERTGSSH